MSAIYCMTNMKRLGVLVIVSMIISHNAHATNLSDFNTITIKDIKGNDERGSYTIQYPFLKKPYASKKLNALLKNTSIDSFLCEKDASKKKLMYSTINVKPSFLSKRLFSYMLEYDSYCGGPYPDSGVFFVIADIKKGALVDIKAQFTDFKKFKYLVIDEFQKQRPRDYVKDCQHLSTREELALVTPEFLLKNKTLIARQDYAHVARACEYDIVIHCDLLMPYLKQNSSLADYCS
jgi:hypothetical protein